MEPLPGGSSFLPKASVSLPVKWGRNTPAWEVVGGIIYEMSLERCTVEFFSATRQQTLIFHVPSSSLSLHSDISFPSLKIRAKASVISRVFTHVLTRWAQLLSLFILPFFAAMSLQLLDSSRSAVLLFLSYLFPLFPCCSIVCIIIFFMAVD